MYTPTQLLDFLVNISGLGQSFISAELTKEEASHLVEKSADGFYRLGLGYIDPSKIKSFFCGKCFKEFESPPAVEVHIKLKEDWTGNVAGSYILSHTPADEEHALLLGYVLLSDIEQQKINPKHVKSDYSGLIIPVTREAVEQQLQRELEAVEKGQRQTFDLTEKLSRVAGVDLSERIKEARAYEQTKFLEGYSSIQNLTYLLEKGEGIVDSGFFFSNPKDFEDQLSQECAAESLGVNEIDEFINLLPQLALPKELRPRIASFLASYAKAYSPAIADAQDAVKDARAEVDRLRAEKRNLQALAKSVKSQSF